MRTLLVTVSLLLTLPGMAEGAEILINNGLAPPYPDNVIDDSSYQMDYVHVRDLGCGIPDPNGPCGSPGVATTVHVTRLWEEPWTHGVVGALAVHDSSIAEMQGTAGGVIARGNSSLTVGDGAFMLVLRAHGSSTVTIDDAYEIEDEFSVFDSASVVVNGGYVFATLVANNSSSVIINGGDIGGVVARDSSTMTLNGGSLWYVASATGSALVRINGGGGYQLRALDDSLIEVAGLGFEVDGAPVPYGDLGASTGNLTGVLASGESIDVLFYQGGAPCQSSVCTGTIHLLSVPDQDEDIVPDAVDNCPTVPNGPADWNQADRDGDGVGDICDNCVEHHNPRGAYPDYRTTTGGQLDDDGDGIGNACDCAGAPGLVCTAPHTLQFKAALNRPVWATDCGSPPSQPCDQFDHDGKDPVITALDTLVFKQLLNKARGPRCPVCPLECVGDACP